MKATSITITGDDLAAGVDALLAFARLHGWIAYHTHDARRADATRGRAKDAAAPRTLATSTEPTATRPGSEDRVRIYEERVERGLAVFHPRDSRLDQGAA